MPLGLMNASYAAAQPLTSPMADSSSATARPAPTLDAATFERRKRFAGFGPDDARLLVVLRPLLEAHVDELVDVFYEHLLSQQELRPLLVDKDVSGRLKGFQRDYLLSLTTGRYDEKYANDRLRIGHIHNQIGLEPQWYLGAYGLYFEHLLPLIDEYLRGKPERVRTTTALSKLLVLDMQLVLDSYYGLREKQAVERSEQLAAVGELAASIAHEVRNPLAGMKGALEVLRKELAVKPSNLEVVDELLAQIVRLENLVRDLLNFARPRALNLQSFDLHEMLDRLLRMYKEQSDQSGITVHRAYEPGTGSLIADPTQMEQVFLNLIHNAVQAMEQGGVLHVHTRKQDHELVISFRDTGKGIAPADLQRIFQPFFTTKHRGSGLGLPIVLKIAEAHGGRVEIRSRLGKGTTAIVTIPV